MDKGIERKAGSNSARASTLNSSEGPGRSLTRRTFGKGVLAVGATTAVGLPALSARAATTVKFIGWQGFDTAVDVDNWYEKHDIGLTTTYIASNEETIAALRHGGTGAYDVCTPDAFFTPLYVKHGLLEPLDLDRIPNFKRLFPIFQSAPGTNIGGVQYSLPFMWGAMGIMYNAEVITEVPTTWQDLFREEYRKKAVIVADPLGMLPVFTIAATGTRSPTRVTQAEFDAGVELMIKFKKEHALTLAADYGEQSAIYGSGEAIIGVSWDPVAIWAGADAPDLRLVIPEEGSLTFIGGYGMVADTPNKDLVYEILNQALSPEAQAKLGDTDAVAITVAEGVPLLSEGMRDLYPYDDIEGYFARAGGITELYPFEAEGDLVTYDQMLDGWERFLRA